MSFVSCMLNIIFNIVWVEQLLEYKILALSHFIYKLPFAIVR